MPKRYMPPNDADEQMMQDVLREHHGDLVDFSVVFQFAVNEDKDGAMVMPKPNKHGVIKLGKAKCFPAEDRAAGCPDFLITLCYNWWEEATEKQRRALVDHELCHCGVEYDADDNAKPMSVPHEFEGFLDELKRHGAWDSRLKQVETQLQLFVPGVGSIDGKTEEEVDEAVGRLVDSVLPAAQ